jgi:hypothetical protein
LLDDYITWPVVGQQINEYPPLGAAVGISASIR